MHQKTKEKLPREALTEAAREAPTDHPESPQIDPKEALFEDPLKCQNVWFSLGFTAKTKTCDSKNGKRARGISAKERLSLLESKLALYNSPCPRSFHSLLRRSANKVSSAARSLASLGSTQLASGVPREVREAKKKSRPGFPEKSEKQKKKPERIRFPRASKEQAP